MFLYLNAIFRRSRELHGTLIYLFKNFNLFIFQKKATAWYRLLPEIILKSDFYDEQAEKIKSCFSPGVIKIVDDDKKEGIS